MNNNKDNLRVLYIDQGIQFGGAIIVVANLLRHIDLEKVTPIVATAMPTDIVKSKLRARGEQIDINVARKLMNYDALERTVRKIRKVPSATIRKVLIYFLYAFRLLANTPYMLRIAWLIKSKKIDLVHMNNGYGNDEADLVCMLLRMPRIVHLHGSIPLSAVQRKVLQPSVRAFISISEHIKSEAEIHGVDIDRVQVIPNPVVREPISENSRAILGEKYGLTDENRTFAIFGRIVNWKGHKQFVAAAAKVIAALPYARAVIVGNVSDGGEQYLRELEALIEQLGIRDQIIFTGYIDNVADYYEWVDVGVHCSIDPEPFGLVITEAMSAGKPVVGSCYGAAPEIISDGRDGFIADPHDADAVAEKVIRLLSNDAECEQMGRVAKKNVLDKYDADKYSRDVEQFYRSSMP